MLFLAMCNSGNNMGYDGLAGVDVDRGELCGRSGGGREGRVHRQAAEQQRGRRSESAILQSSLMSVFPGVACVSKVDF